ncbi:acyltransferase [Mucilaginibacter arboris]|uniref:Acyltransferase n=1 Tax=Mucilaginibacter arboris TaxID=2682090 RepID=A0A7K1T052_9SPHI|nr:acyltransferase [Mucilaginibacter arboris]MVN22945.1 acyltransferase [Mucilaginibacter arboris]
MGLKDAVKNNPSLKKLVHWTLIPTGQAKPRTWVKWFVNPFFHKKKQGSMIRRRTRMDVFPFNRFELGQNAVIEDFCTINNGVGNVLIGDKTTIGMSNVLIGPVIIGKNVIIAQNVVISGLNHNYEDVNLPIQAQGVKTALVVIEDDCWIGANAVVTAGTTIGKHCVIAAGAVVTKNVPSFSVAAGNPAGIIKKYDQGQKAWIKVN